MRKAGEQAKQFITGVQDILKEEEQYYEDIDFDEEEGEASYEPPQDVSDSSSHNDLN